MIKSEDLTFPKIKEKINKAGNLFYQYRACRRDAADLLVWLSKSEKHKGKAAVCCVACDKQLHEKKNHQVMQ